MSIEAITAALYCSQSKAAAKLVLIAIADGISRGTDCWYAYVDEIAELSGYSHRFTTKQIEKLRNAGELVIEQIGGKRCNYSIPLLAGEEGYEPTACTENHFCNGWHTPLSITRTETARKNRKARQQAAKKKGRPVRNDSSQDSQEREFLGTGGHENEQDIGTIGPNGRNDSSQDIGTIVPATRSYSSYVVPIEDISVSIPVITPVRYPGARARASTSTLAEKLDEETEPEPDHTPPAPPSPGPEARRIWHDMRAAMVPKVGQPVVTAWGSQCHLYEAGPDQWQLRLGPGIPIAMFKARFEALLTDELCRQMKASNQILQIVRAG